MGEWQRQALGHDGTAHVRKKWQFQDETRETGAVVSMRSTGLQRTSRCSGDYRMTPRSTWSEHVHFEELSW